mgnify:CR=1 FL=1
MENTLKELKPGDRAVILKINGEGAIKRRLMDLGVTRGAEVIVKKFAPLGDPMEVNVRGCELAFRKSEAANIVVRKIS